MNKIQYSVMFLCNSLLLVATHDLTLEARKKAIHNHKSALESLETAVNPLTAAISSTATSKNRSLNTSAITETEINKAPLNHQEKIAKLNADKLLKKELTRFAQNLSDNPLTAQSLQHFDTLETQEQIDQIKHYISIRNREQLAEIIKLKTEYREELAKFQNKTQDQAFTEIKKLEKTIKDNNHEILIAQDKLAKTSPKTIEYQQLDTKIQNLQNQNTMNNQSIDQHLTLIEQKLSSIDASLKEKYQSILKNYQNKDLKLHSVITPGLIKAGKQIQFQTKVKVSKPKPIKPVIEETKHPSFVPGVSVDALKNDPFLNVKIKAIKKAIKQEKELKQPDQYKIQYLQDLLEHYKKAAKN